MIKYSVIVPIYNEEEVIETCYEKLKEVMEKTEENYEIIFINDGSIDKSVEIITNICERDETVALISFSRNFGHQNALTAGMEHAIGMAVIAIDSDLQDPPHIILDMIKKWKEGYHVVYGKRQKRRGESFFKKISAYLYYRILRALTTVEIPVDVADFRLIDRRICNILNNQISEKNRYIRGLVAFCGFKQTFVEYERDERLAGETKYPLKKMIKFAVDGITGFSYKPLKIATKIGFFISLFSFTYLCYVIYEALFLQRPVVGWASTISIILFFQGIVLIVLGIIGEYIGRIFEEIKGRPIYLIEKSINIKSGDVTKYEFDK
ncbi:MAG: glycosyltransferase family 2 protein [Defluviitaleaceae bacterium]|nr:glycosyltransferase family 2 protein [Defluviitaleaceae bacterium]